MESWKERESLFLLSTVGCVFADCAVYSAVLDAAVRNVLVPGTTDSALSLPLADLYSTTQPSPYPTLTSSSDTPIASYTILPTSLTHIQSHLLRGERRLALQYALDQHMWAHAMVLASSIDQATWKEVVAEFVQFEMGTGVGGGQVEGSNGRESMRVAYGLFAGAGPSASEYPLPIFSSSQPLTSPHLSERVPASSLTPWCRRKQSPHPCPVRSSNLPKLPFSDLRADSFGCCACSCEHTV